MQFTLASELPTPPDKVWTVLLDVRRIAGCIPGCEQVEEVAALAHYKALMKQKKDLAAIQAARPTAEFDAAWAGGRSPDEWVEMVYRGLERQKKK